MNLIMFSLDGNVSVAHSADHKRMLLYAQHFDSAHIIVPGHQNALLQFNTMYFHTVKRGNKLILFFKLLAKGFAVRKNYFLHTNDTVITTQDPFELGLIGYLLSLVTGIPLHTQVHIDFFSPYFKSESLRQRIQAAIAVFILKRAKRVRVVSKKIADYLAGAIKIPKDRVDVAPLFINFDAYGNIPLEPIAKPASTTPYFLLAARFVKQKNIPLAIRAFKDVHAKYPQYRFKIIGSGKEEGAIKEVIYNLGLSDAVEMRPWTDNLQSEYRNAFAFILCSNYEGWGRTGVESCISGTPVVMTDIGCANELLFNKKHCLIVPVNDQNALRDAMLELIEDKQLHAALKSNLSAIPQVLPTSEKYVEGIVASWKNTLAASK